MKKKLISTLVAAVMLVSMLGLTPAQAASPAVVTFSGPSVVLPGQTYTYAYTLKVTNAFAANANISVGGAFEKVSGGENLFYDPNVNTAVNSTGTVPGSITVRVKSGAAPGSTGTISVLADESKCSVLVFDGSGNVVGDPVISTVTGSISARVAPGTPAAPSVTFVSTSSLRVQWKAVAGASGYQVWRSTSANGTYTWVDTTAGTSSVSTGLSPNTKYYFKIRAFHETTPKNPTLGAYSAYGSGTTSSAVVPGTPAAPSVTPAGGGKLQVQWKAVSNAVGYQVWRSTSANGTYTWVDTTAGTSSVSTGLSPNTKYYFKIRAFHETQPNNPTLGAYSAYGSGTTQK